LRPWNFRNISNAGVILENREERSDTGSIFLNRGLFFIGHDMAKKMVLWNQFGTIFSKALCMGF
jgi:hypothetical protein